MRLMNQPEAIHCTRCPNLQTACLVGFVMLRLLMRLFVALDIGETIRERIAAFVKEVSTLAPGVRWVTAESLHVTLKFIGERPDAMVRSLEEGLRQISAPAFQISFRGCGFFPTEK